MLSKITLSAQRIFVIKAKVKSPLRKYYSIFFLNMQFKMKTILEKNLKK